jgi:nucleotide-binding universal stress UspA family protein
METATKVLACVDRSSYADHVADAAAWAAKAMQSELEFLHILDRRSEEDVSNDHSGALGFNAQETLLTTLAEKDEARVRDMREAGRLFLGQLRERAHAAGAPQVDIRQRHGELQETVMEQERGIDLLVLGRRGESAEVTHRDLGRNVERLIRSLSRPILTVTDQFKPPKKALLAFDGGAATRKCVEMLTQSALLKGVAIRVVMAGGQQGEAEKQLAWARAKLEAAGFECQVSFFPGDPETVIARVIKEESIDLLVMGAYSHSPIRALLFGSKTNELLRSARVPTLLVR